MNGRPAAFAAQSPYKLKPHQRPQTVAEDCVRQVGLRAHHRCELIDDGIDTVESRLAESPLAAWQLNGADLDIGRERLRVVTVNLRAATGTRMILTLSSVSSSSRDGSYCVVITVTSCPRRAKARASRSA